jgi:hypothetical protein
MSDHFISPFTMELNNTIKIVWYEKFSEKCYLALALPTESHNKALYKMKIAVSYVEMLSVQECLQKAKKGTPNNFCISESEWNGQKYKLMLKTSEYSGLILVRMKVGKPLDVIGDVPSDDDGENVEPISDTTPPMDEDVVETAIPWEECFDKFYISKYDDWSNLQRIINKFCQQVAHNLKVNELVKSEESSSSSMFKVPEVQKIQGKGKPEKNVKTKKSAAKRPRVIPPTDDEVSKINDKILCLMEKNNIEDSKEIILQHKEDLIPFDYNLLDRLYNIMNETYKILKKISKQSNEKDFIKFICGIVSDYSRFVEQQR